MEVVEIRPNPGPQEQYLSTAADIAFYGGAAGSGKTFATVLDPLRHVHRKGFTAVVLRRTSDRLQGGGSVWEESQGIYPAMGGVSRASPRLEWRWPSGAMLELSHLQYDKDVHSHQSKQYAGIYFEEVCEFTAHQFWYLLSRNRSTCGIRPYIRGTCNPDPDSFVRGMIDWWIGPDGLPIPERSGVIRWFVRDGDDLRWFGSEADAREAFPDRGPLSFTFISARLSDNPKGDPTYRDKLLNMPRIERERLFGGNWDIRAQAGDYFKRSWFDVIDRDERILDSVTRWVRGWDLAATEPSESNADPDWTVGAKVGKLPDGCYVIAHVERLRGGPGAVEAAIKRIAKQDGPNCTQAFWQDPGQAGKAQVPALRRLVASVGGTSDFAVATKDKVGFAKVWSPKVERGEFFVVRGPWNDAFFNEAEGFPTAKHDDQVDAVSRAHEALDVVQVKSFRIKGL